MEQPSTLGIYVISLLRKGQGKDQIKTHLLENGHDDKFVEELVVESVKLYYAKRRTAGLALLLAGAIICFLSFLLTITSSFTQSNFTLVLYGLTSLGIVIAFTGFMKIF